MSAYWQKCDEAKVVIARNLRRHLLQQYQGLPVMVFRNRVDKIKEDNKTWVKNTLKSLDCEDFKVSWQISFEFKLDKSETAIISDFTVSVEGF